MNREMLKSTTLVSLFILCIVLTGQLMLSLSTDRQDNSIQALAVEKTFDIKEIFSPQSFIISFGGGVYTQNYAEENASLWRNVQAELVTYFQSPQSLSSFESIDEKRWVEMVKSRAVRFKMPFDMTLGDMQTMLGLDNTLSSRTETINSILVSTHDLSSVYFGNESTSEYYKMTGTGLSDHIEKSISSVEKKENIIEYRRMEDLFALQASLEDQKQNNNIFPITSMLVDFANVIPEINVKSSDDSTLRSYANKAFGKQFNFVKKMKDVDDSIIYLYGYANKALRLGSDGSIQFTERIQPGSKLDSISLEEALQLAMNYIDQYGGAPSSLYLANYTMHQDNDDNLVYILEFDYRIRDLPVLTDSIDNGHSIRVEIVGNQVTNFVRAIHRYKDSFMLDYYRRALTINEILDRNGNRIQGDYEAKLNQDIMLSEDEIWTRILGDISNVELAYYVVDSNTKYLYPVWKVDVGKTSYVFRLYDGRLLKSHDN